jgi:unsaturated rhamnogalacturonyl hydrolase
MALDQEPGGLEPLPGPASHDLPLSLAAATAVMARRPAEGYHWRYEDGLVLLGIREAGLGKARPDLVDFSRRAVERLVSPDGSIEGYRRDEYNLDQVNPGKLLFGLRDGTGDPRYAKAIAALAGQLRTQPRTPSGGFWHKGIYPNQMWLDGLYMAAPFYLRLCLEGEAGSGAAAGAAAGAAIGAAAGAARGGEAAATGFGEPGDVIRQFELAETHCLDHSTGLLRHAWDEARLQAWADPETGRSPHAWGRAMGWFAMALVDCIGLARDASLAGGAGSAAAAFEAPLAGMLRRLAEAVSHNVDGESGLAWQVMDRPGEEGNYLECSASCMFAYAFSKGAALGVLEPRFLDAARKAWASIRERFVAADEDGLLSLGGICQVAGLGGKPYRDGSYRYYLSEPVVRDDYKGLGPFILAALEMEKSS